MLGNPITFKRIAPNNQMPFYFSDEDVERIFSVISNVKHLAMLSTLFYGCLKASELCQLNDEDLDLSSLTLRINGRGGQEGLACINNDCANVLREYLDIRPPQTGGRSSAAILYGLWTEMETDGSSLHAQGLQKEGGSREKRRTARVCETYTSYSDDC
jgi:site-specific recombinase XerD